MKLKNVFLSVTTVMALGAAQTGYAKECLQMGLIPAEDPKAMLEQYKPMVKWLSEEVGTCIEMKPSTDYTGVIEAMHNKKVDIAWFGPFSYVMANERAGAQAFAVGANNEGKTGYRSYLVATPEVAKTLDISEPLTGEAGMASVYKKLESHKKEYTFAFTDVASTSGYAAPRYFMHLVGMDPKKTFKKVGYVGTHDAAELVIKNNIINIVADNDVNYPKMLAKGQISKETNVVIWQSDELPGSPLAYRGDLSSEMKHKLEKAITNIPKDIVTGYGKIVGYKLVKDADYQMVKNIKKTIDEIR